MESDAIDIEQVDQEESTMLLGKSLVQKKAASGRDISHRAAHIFDLSPAGYHTGCRIHHIAEHPVRLSFLDHHFSMIHPLPAYQHLSCYPCNISRIRQSDDLRDHQGSRGDRNQLIA